MRDNFDFYPKKAYVKGSALGKEFNGSVYEVDVLMRLSDGEDNDETKDTVQVAFYGKKIMVKGGDLYQKSNMKYRFTRGSFYVSSRTMFAAMNPTELYFMTDEGIVGGEDIMLKVWSRDRNVCAFGNDKETYGLPERTYKDKLTCMDCESYNVTRVGEDGKVTEEKIEGRFYAYRLDKEQMNLVHELEQVYKKLVDAKVVLTNISGYDSVYAYSEKEKKLSFEDFVDAENRRIPDEIAYCLDMSVSYESEDYGTCIPE